jgi:hypothetical protein
MIQILRDRTLAHHGDRRVNTGDRRGPGHERGLDKGKSMPEATVTGLTGAFLSNSGLCSDLCRSAVHSHFRSTLSLIEGACGRTGGTVG